MGRKELAIGGRYGRLTVISRGSYLTTSGAWKWVCRCDCGTQKEIISRNLRGGKTRSCGCLEREHRFKPAGHSAFIQVLWSYRQNARLRKIPFELTEEQFSAFTSQNCHYCGGIPFGVKRTPGGKFVYSGLDRKDNTLGYTMDNCVPCCSRCNEMKMDRTAEEFIASCKLIASRYA